MQFYYYAYRKTCMDVIKQTNYQDLETKIFRHNYEIENWQQVNTWMKKNIKVCTQLIM